jgi:hypothetical protein
MHLHAHHVPHEIQMSAIDMTRSEASGERLINYGLRSSRQTTPPRGLVLGWRRFLDPGIHPRPSDHHPAPRRPAA